MASPAEVANDLEAHARYLEKTHFKNVAKSCARGAETIRDLMEKARDLEAAADAEAQAFERYRNGEGR